MAAAGREFPLTARDDAMAEVAALEVICAALGDGDETTWECWEALEQARERLGSLDGGVA